MSPVPFLRDVEVHVRFLVAMPLLIGAELLVHGRVRPPAEPFRERRLVPDGAIPRFDAALASAARLRNSVIAEVLLIAFVHGVGVLLIWRQNVALSPATWFANPSAGDRRLSLAGRWYGYVSLPIFQFLLLRWYFRIFIWGRFLWQVSRIRLNLVPTYPDEVGGLGFLALPTSGFVPLALAHGALLAGQIAEVKRTGLREYGALAQRYVREFDGKWLRGGAPAGEPLLGSGDIQSLAELKTLLRVVF